MVANLQSLQILFLAASLTCGAGKCLALENHVATDSSEYERIFSKGKIDSDIEPVSNPVPGISPTREVRKDGESPIFAGRKSLTHKTNPFALWKFNIEDEYIRSYLELGGVPDDYPDEDAFYFARRNTHPFVFYGHIAEFGLSANEDRALNRAGVTFALRELAEFTLWHDVALASDIVTGKVVEIRNIAGEPYHRAVRIKVIDTLKSCTNHPLTDFRTFWMVNSGLYNTGSNMVIEDHPLDPSVRIGGKVLFVAGNNPVNLREQVTNMAVQGALRDYRTENWGSRDELLRQASMRHSPKFEIYASYKLVRNSLIENTGGLKPESFIRRIRKDRFALRASKIYKAQENYCHDRYMLSWHQP